MMHLHNTIESQDYLLQSTSPNTGSERVIRVSGFSQYLKIKMKRNVKKGYFSHPKLHFNPSAAWWWGGPHAHLAGGFLLLGAEIFWHFPAASGEVEDGGGRHVRGLGVVGVVEGCGGR